MSDRIEEIRRWVNATAPSNHSGLCDTRGCYWCTTRYLLTEVHRLRERVAVLDRDGGHTDVAHRLAVNDAFARGALDEKVKVRAWLKAKGDESFQHMGDVDHDVEHGRTVHSAQCLAYHNADRALQLDEHRRSLTPKRQEEP